MFAERGDSASPSNGGLSLVILEAYLGVLSNYSVLTVLQYADFSAPNLNVLVALEISANRQ